MNEKNRNLALRVGSALLLAPLLLWVTWHGGLAFALLLGAAAALGASELAGMFARIEPPDWFGIAVAGLIPVIPWWAVHAWGGALPGWSGLALASAAIVLMVVNLLRPGPFEAMPLRTGVMALAWLYVGVLIGTVAALRVHHGFAWVVVDFAVAWLNDTFAYFAGRFLGKTPLYPRVSPKKTWEGFAGGAVGSVLGALIAKAIFPGGWLPGLGWAGCVGLGLGAAVLGPLGDLAESLLKRAAKRKDSGVLIPGHGGLLDRIDALLFIGPWVYAWAQYSR